MNYERVDIAVNSYHDWERQQQVMVVRRLLAGEQQAMLPDGSWVGVPHGEVLPPYLVIPDFLMSHIRQAMDKVLT